MNKKHILILMLGALSFANFASGSNEKAKEDINLEDMKTPEETSAEISPKTSNPFPEQDKEFVNLFKAEKAEDVFALSTEDPFMDTDPWDN
jgi:hypothetical protein